MAGNGTGIRKFLCYPQKSPHRILWGDFLLKQIRRELNYMAYNFGKIGLSAFICCFMGILLWVNGTNILYVLRSKTINGFSASVTGTFLLWLVAYGLCGAALSLIFLLGQTRQCKNLLIAFSVCCMIYLLQLAWYAVFFCTSLLIFAFIILFTAFLLTILLFFLVRHSFVILKIIIVTVALVELYFIYFNLTFYLS